MLVLAVGVLTSQRALYAMARHAAVTLVATVLSIATVAAVAATAAADNRQLVFLDTPGEEATCLDGSPYAFYIWPGTSSNWSFFINGGGWCLNEEECQIRAGTALGSSKGYNISGAWGPPPGNRNGGPAAYTCQGLDPNCTRVFLPYCDGSCFSSFRKQPWPVNGTASASPALHFRGFANLARTLDVLEARFGLGQARRAVVQGGSAGGLSTFLHVDYVADRLRAAAATATATATGHEATARAPSSPVLLRYTQRAPAPPPAPAPLVVVGRPVAGFFIDELNFDPSIPSYAENIAYGVAMFNATPPLSPACKATQPRGEQWRCWMAPYAAPHVRQPLFVVQSRFDEFQLMALLGLPCFQGQNFEPPFKPANCTAQERGAIVAFGAALVSQMQPLLAAKPDTGTWLVSCIQHDVVCVLHGAKEEDAFASWLAKGALGKSTGYRWRSSCGSGGASPCETGSHCAPPVF